jgi:hypothetical protein
MAFNLGLAAGSAVDAYKSAAEFSYQQQQRNAQLAVQHQIQNGPKVGDVKGGVNPVPLQQQLAQLNFSKAQIATILAHSPSPDQLTKLVEAAGGPKSLVFYNDPSTGKIMGTQDPAKYDSYDVQKFAANAMLSSGSPDLMAQGSQMLNSVQQQQLADTQIASDKMALGMKQANVLFAQGDYKDGLAAADGAIKNVLPQGWEPNFTQNKDGTFSYSITTPSGQNVGAETLDPQKAQMMIANMSDPTFSLNYALQSKQVANGTLEAQAALASAGAAQISAGADVTRADAAAQLDRTIGGNIQLQMQGNTALNAQYNQLTQQLNKTTDPYQRNVIQQQMAGIAGHMPNNTDFQQEKLLDGSTITRGPDGSVFQYTTKQGQTIPGYLIGNANPQDVVSAISGPNAKFNLSQGPDGRVGLTPVGEQPGKDGSYTMYPDLSSAMSAASAPSPSSSWFGGGSTQGAPWIGGAHPRPMAPSAMPPTGLPPTQSGTGMTALPMSPQQPSPQASAVRPPPVLPYTGGVGAGGAAIPQAALATDAGQDLYPAYMMQNLLTQMQPQQAMPTGAYNGFGG